jgi:hypothetical protein
MTAHLSTASSIGTTRLVWWARIIWFPASADLRDLRALDSVGDEAISELGSDVESANYE